MCAERKPVISEHSFRKFVFSVFQGAFTFRGSVIDMPLLKQAQNIVRLAISIKEKWSAKWSSHQVGWTYTVGSLKTSHNTQGNLLVCQMGAFLHLQFMLITFFFFFFWLSHWPVIPLKMNFRLFGSKLMILLFMSVLQVRTYDFTGR